MVVEEIRCYPDFGPDEIKTDLSYDEQGRMFWTEPVPRGDSWVNQYDIATKHERDIPKQIYKIYRWLPRGKYYASDQGVTENIDEAYEVDPPFYQDKMTKRPV